MLKLEWESELREHQTQNNSTVIGLMCGARENNDRRVVDSLAASLTSKLLARPVPELALVVRLNVLKRLVVKNRGKLPQPPVSSSPLGPWSDVTIDVPVGRTASAELLALPGWISLWKRQFELVLVDLGPINLVPSRVIGKMCDFNQVILGPVSCGASDWILEHVAWLERAGANIDGTISVQMSRGNAQSTREELGAA